MFLQLRFSSLCRMPCTLQVAVFDTAFHQTMPPSAFMYGLPWSLYKDHAIRRYGFHGTSYKFLVGRAADAVRKSVDQVNLIACHLGERGCNVCHVGP